MEISKRIYKEDTQSEHYVIKWEIVYYNDISIELYKEIEELIFQKILMNN
jgi:hypothetical protein